MPNLMYREIQRLKKHLLSLCARVEENLADALRSLDTRDEELARQVIETDAVINQMEVEVEEDCLKILALFQPVASDLRYLISVMKINNDLERIGDLAVNVAEQSTMLARLPLAPPPFDLSGMAEKAQDMVRRSLDSLIDLNADQARAICAADDEVDAIYHRMPGQLQTHLQTRPEHLPQMMHYMTIAHNLERVADHATNIAEDSIYLLEGTIVRHGHLLQPPEA